MKKIMRSIYSVTSFILILFILFVLPFTAIAGPLRLVAPGGPESAFGTLTFSESDLDFQRPANLLRYERPRLTITKEYETIIHQKKQDNVEYSGASKKSRIEFLHPLNENEKYRSVYAGARFGSRLKFIADTSKLNNTFTYNKGTGGSNAFAQRIGPLSFGYFINESRNNGEGYSSEVNNKIDWLDPDAEMFSLIKARKEGVHFKAALSKRLSAGYLKTNEDVFIKINFFDAGDDYEFPFNVEGERRELSLEYDAPGGYSLSAYFNHASFYSLDDVTYYSNNLSTSIGRSNLVSEYDSRAFYIRKNLSPNRYRMIGYEDYNGHFKFDAFVNIFGGSFNILGDHLLKSYGDLNQKTLKYSTSWRKGNYRYRFAYSFSKGSSLIHSDINEIRHVFIVPVYIEKYNETYNYDVRTHVMGLGVEKNVAKDTVLKYSLIQTVPVWETKEPPAVATSGDATAIKKKTRGGTLHLLSITFLL